MNYKNLVKTIVILPALMLFLSNCASVTKTSFLVKSEDSIKIGYTQLKVLMYTFYDTFSSSTEQSANYIINNTDDREIKKMALRWKINGIAEARRSVSLADPYAALIDSRAYCFQLEDFFKTDSGKEYFGEYQHIAIETSEKLIKEIDNITLQTISQSRYNKQQPKFEKWVDANPISGPEFARVSTVSLFVDYMGEDTKNLTSSLSSIEEALTDIRGRLTLYSMSLPKQAQWQTELLIEENLERHEIDGMLKDIDTIAVSLNEINQFIQEVDYLLAKVMSDSFKEVDRQRLESIAGLQAERQLIVELLQSERQILLDAISLERERTMKDAESLTNGIMADTGSMMYDVVDHVFYRIIQLSAILAVVVFASLFGYKKLRSGKTS